MTFNEFQKACVATEPKYLTRGDEALLGLMGLNSGAGDLVGLYKKTLYEGAVLDETAFVEGLCDICWSLAITANAVGCDLEKIVHMTLTKKESV